MVRSIFRGVGAYLPERILTNSELEQTLDTSDTWIAERTGIRRRHIAADGETTSDLATAAAAQALERAGIKAADLDLILVATATPDNTFPATATKVMQKLGAGPCMAFDLQAVCAGFAYALATADNFLRVGQAKTALVIGAETFSRIIDWQDRNTAVLFGDGAGAVVLQAEEGTNTHADRGILATDLAADGRYYDQLYVDGGPSTTGTSGHLRMNGKEVFRHAVTRLASSAANVITQAGFEPTQVDWVVPHQANKRIIDAVANRMGVDQAKVVITVQDHANTSAASIPLALETAVRDGRIKQGDLVLMNAMGGGFAWGAALARW